MGFPSRHVVPAAAKRSVKFFPPDDKLLEHTRNARVHSPSPLSPMQTRFVAVCNLQGFQVQRELKISRLGKWFVSG